MEVTSILILCALIALGSLATAVWVAVSGQIATQGLDALFLIVVCLVFALMFGIAPAQAIRKGQWKKQGAPKKESQDGQKAA